MLPPFVRLCPVSSHPIHSLPPVMIASRSQDSIPSDPPRNTASLTESGPLSRPPRGPALTPPPAYIGKAQDGPCRPAVLCLPPPSDSRAAAADGPSWRGSGELQTQIQPPGKMGRLGSEKPPILLGNGLTRQLAERLLNVWLTCYRSADKATVHKLSGTTYTGPVSCKF